MKPNQDQNLENRYLLIPTILLWCGYGKLAVLIGYVWRRTKWNATSLRVDERFLRHDVFAGRASRWFGHDELAGASFASRLCKNQIERNLGVVRIAVVHNR